MQYAKESIIDEDFSPYFSARYRAMGPFPLSLLPSNSRVGRIPN